MMVSILTGGKDSHYALESLEALVSRPIRTDFIEHVEIAVAEIAKHGNVNYLNLRGIQSTDPEIVEKVVEVLKYYAEHTPV